MNGDAARSVQIPLSFLGRGRYEARIWADGATPAVLTRSTRAVTAGDSLSFDLAATGGAVAILTAR